MHRKKTVKKPLKNKKKITKNKKNVKGKKRINKALDKVLKISEKYSKKEDVEGLKDYIKAIKKHSSDLPQNPQAPKITKEGQSKYDENYRDIQASYFKYGFNPFEQNKDRSTVTNLKSLLMSEGILNPVQVEIQKNLSTIEKEQKQKEKQIKKNEEEINKQLDLIRNLHDEKEQLIQENRSIKADQDDMKRLNEEEINRQRKLIRDAEKKVNELDETNEKLLKNIQGLQIDQNELLRINEHLAQQNREYDEKIKGVTQQLDDTTQQLDITQKKVETLDKNMIYPTVDVINTELKKQEKNAVIKKEFLIDLLNKGKVLKRINKNKTQLSIGKKERLQQIIELDKKDGKKRFVALQEQIFRERNPNLEAKVAKEIFKQFQQTFPNETAELYEQKYLNIQVGEIEQVDISPVDDFIAKYKIEDQQLIDYLKQVENNYVTDNEEYDIKDLEIVLNKHRLAYIEDKEKQQIKALPPEVQADIKTVTEPKRKSITTKQTDIIETLPPLTEDPIIEVPLKKKAKKKKKDLFETIGNPEPDPQEVSDFTQQMQALNPDLNLPPAPPVPTLPTDTTQPEQGFKASGKTTNKPLSNFDLENIMKPYVKQGFKGVFLSDALDTVKVSPKDKYISFIINTLTKHNYKNQIGHWVAVYIDVNNKIVEYFDSFGLEPNEMFYAQIRKVLKKMNVDIFQMKINRIKYQRNNSNRCGLHSSKFIIDRMHGEHFKEASGYNKVHNSIKGEKNIRMFEKSLKPFLNYRV